MSVSLLVASANSVPGYEPQFRPMLEEDVSGRLLRVDPDSVVGNDGRWDLKLLRRELEHGVKGVCSGTDSTLNGSLGSDVRVILNVTLEAAIPAGRCWKSP